MGIMATLREVQHSLQEKLELLCQREKHVELLEANAAMKDKEIEYLRKQLTESRDLVQQLTQMNSHQRHVINKLNFQFQQLNVCRQQQQHLDQHQTMKHQLPQTAMVQQQSSSFVPKTNHSTILKTSSPNCSPKETCSPKEIYSPKTNGHSKSILHPINEDQQEDVSSESEILPKYDKIGEKFVF